MAETAPATTSGGTTEGVDGSATGSGSGPATGSSGGSGTSDGPGTSSGPGEESSSGGDPPGPAAGQPYGPCDEGACMGEGVVCWADHPGFDMCLPPCDGTNPSCPAAPPDNGALVECVEVLGVHCMLNCAGGAQCPAGTTCEEVSAGILRCLWP